MAFLGTLNPWVLALVIFLLRILQMALDTLRMLLMMRNMKLWTWVLGFIGTTIFVVALGSVMANMTNFLNIFVYAAGFATGNVLGMVIEQRLCIGHNIINIISSRFGQALAEKLRNEGYAVTEIPARGKDGMVSMLSCSVLRKQVKDIEKLILEIDPAAFITVEDITPIHRGFWRL